MKEPGGDYFSRRRDRRHLDAALELCAVPLFVQLPKNLCQPEENRLGFLLLPPAPVL
jgi:hypothetical protein